MLDESAAASSPTAEPIESHRRFELEGFGWKIMRNCANQLNARLTEYRFIQERLFGIADIVGVLLDGVDLRPPRRLLHRIHLRQQTLLHLHNHRSAVENRVVLNFAVQLRRWSVLLRHQQRVVRRRLLIVFIHASAVTAENGDGEQDDEKHAHDDAKDHEEHVG